MLLRATFVAVVFLSGCIAPFDNGPDPSDEDVAVATPNDAAPADGDPGLPDVSDDDVVPPNADGSAPGTSCGCDADCAGDTVNPGRCVYGICMQLAAEACPEAGSQSGCPTGARCWSISNDDGLCWPDCDASTCAGTCDGDGSCAPVRDACDASCGALCPAAGCTSDAGCPGDQVCRMGTCVADLGAPPSGPFKTCDDVPDWRCLGGDAECSAVVPFEPVLTAGWWNYPINGETSSNQYRSFIRRDLMKVIQHAAAKVACIAEDWPGNGGPLGIGDLSEADGSIPGTSNGQPGHPPGSHTNGHDADIAYYQVGTPDNRLREVCPHTISGIDQYRCVDDPGLLDPWRTALFIGLLHVDSQVLSAGVDGRIAPIIYDAIEKLCSVGALDNVACTQPRISYENSDTGLGWYRFHHHHLHVTYKHWYVWGMVGSMVPFARSVLPLDEDPRTAWSPPWQIEKMR